MSDDDQLLELAAQIVDDTLYTCAVREDARVADAVVSALDSAGLLALARAGFSTTREQGRYEYVGNLDENGVFWPLDGAVQFGEHTYEPVFRRVDGP